MAASSQHKKNRDDSALRKFFSQAVSDSGFSHAEIARRSNLHRSTISYALNGTYRASVPTWDRILKAAGIQIGYKVR